MNSTELKEPHLRRAGICVLLGLILGIPCAAGAEGISGYAEYNYSLLNSTSKDTSGTSKTKSSSFNQRYNLTMDKEFFPTLRFIAGGSFEKTDSDNDTDGLSSSSSSSRISPNADLSYNNGVFNGGVGFSRRMESSKSNGVSTPTIYFDSYNARFGWKPEDLPSLDINYSLFNNYDENHTTQDTTSASTILSSRYKPFDSLDMSYQANYSTLDNKLAGFNSQSISQSLRLSYSDIFFKDRISVSTSYNIATQETKMQNSGTGSIISVPSLKSVDALYYFVTATTDNPTLTPSFASGANSTTSVTNTVIFAPDLATQRDNVGLKSNFSAVNIVRLPVAITTINGTVIDANNIKDQDISNIAVAFGLNTPQTAMINVYQSPDSDGNNWKQLTGATVSFGKQTNYVTGALSVGFEILLGETVPANTIIKVDIQPVHLIPQDISAIRKITLAAPEVYLQENTPLKPGQSRSTSQVSGLYDLNAKVRLLNVPTIFYDVSFNLDHSSSDTQDLTYRYTVINGLSLNHRFSPTLSTSARVAREDAVDPVAGSRSSNSASVSLSSQTLPTLTQSLNYGYRQDIENGITKNQHSANISNSAELYRGINFNLTGGGSMVSDNTGVDQKSLTVTSGLNLLPHKTLSINLTASDSRAWSTSADQVETTSATQTGDLSVTFNPLPGIYLFGSYTINAQKNRKTQTTQSIGGSWSPFRDGALLLNTSYRENIDNSGNKDKTMVQSLRWNIRSGWYLDVSYVLTNGTSTTQTTDTQIFSTSLRMSF